MKVFLLVGSALMATATYQGISDFQTASSKGALPFLQEELRDQALVENTVASPIPELAFASAEEVHLGAPPDPVSEEERERLARQTQKRKRVQTLENLTEEEKEKLRTRLVGSMFSRAPLSPERIAHILPEGTTHHDFLTAEQAEEMDEELEREMRWRAQMDSIREVEKAEAFNSKANGKMKYK